MINSTYSFKIRENVFKKAAAQLLIIRNRPWRNLVIKYSPDKTQLYSYKEVYPVSIHSVDHPVFIEQSKKKKSYVTFLSKNLDKKKTIHFKQWEYFLDIFHRSNQDTCLVHKPAVNEGDWVQPGDLLADCSASIGGELALGHNILVAYMPWEGFNYEDAILLSERLVFDDVYTSIHIERYEIETKETKIGKEVITREIPDVSEKELKHLDKNGIAKLGTWVEEGDILVGKITPITQNPLSDYQKLLVKLFEKDLKSIKDSSLRAPKGIKSKVIKIQVLKYKNVLATQKIGDLVQVLTKKRGRKAEIKKERNQQNIKNKKIPNKKTNFLLFRKIKNLKKRFCLQKFTHTIDMSRFFPKTHPWFSTLKSFKQFNLKNLEKKKLFLNSFLSKKNKTHKNYLFPRSRGLNRKTVRSETANLPASSFSVQKLNPFKRFSLDPVVSSKLFTIFEKKQQLFAFNSFSKKTGEKKRIVQVIKLPTSQMNSSKYNHFLHNKKIKILGLNNRTQKQNRQTKKSKNKKIPTNIHIYLAEKRKIQVGDKMAGRHGNKGIISLILPRQDMPFLPDGSPVDIVLNPLGVPSRMNVGQIYECLLGLAGKYLGEHYKIFPFDEIYGPEASRSFVYSKLYEARKKTGFQWLFDPSFPGKIRIYDGRNGEAFDQPVTIGRAYILKLVHMVDDKIHSRSTGPYSLVTQQPLRGRSKMGGQRLGEMEVWAIEGYGAAFTLLEMLTIKSDDMNARQTLWSSIIFNKQISIGTPEAFNVLVRELQALCLDIGLFYY